MNPDETVAMEIPLRDRATTRREDVEFKQMILARLLADAECDSVLLLEPMNFRWLTSGSLLRGTFGPDEFPALFANSHQRWLLCSSTDTQRFFDEELDGLGFQVKEWPWSGSREQHLIDICFRRKVACDRPFRDCKQIGTFLHQERCSLSRYEESQLRSLGEILVHALEATARNMSPGETEAEIAGHLSHRLLRHGAEPSAVQIAADDRVRSYRRPGVSQARVENRCLLQATASRAGLFATASRTVAFDSASPTAREEYDAAARLSAMWLATARIGDRPAVLLETQRLMFQNSVFEHEWRLAAPGWWTGRAPSETAFALSGTGKFADGHAVVFRTQIGGCAVADTYVLRPDGWVPMTTVQEWPSRRYSLHGVKYERPDLLVRDKGEN